MDIANIYFYGMNSMEVEMSLICTETREYITYGDSLYCGLTKNDRFIYALSQETVNRLPEAERRPQPCATPEDGLDIHEATSDGLATSRGAYQWSTLKKGKFLFSISAGTAKTLLPMLWLECQPGATPTPPTVSITVQAIPTKPETIH